MTLRGWIMGASGDVRRLLDIGIELGAEHTYSNGLVMWEDCRVSDATLSRLDALWGLFSWSLKPDVELTWKEGSADTFSSADGQRIEHKREQLFHEGNEIAELRVSWWPQLSVWGATVFLHVKTKDGGELDGSLSHPDRAAAKKLGEKAARALLEVA